MDEINMNNWLTDSVNHTFSSLQMEHIYNSDGSTNSLADNPDGCNNPSNHATNGPYIHLINQPTNQPSNQLTLQLNNHPTNQTNFLHTSVILVSSSLGFQKELSFKIKTKVKTTHTEQ